MDPATGPQLDDDELARLYDSVRRELHSGHVTMAVAAAEQILAARPDSTSAHELMGDVLAAQGKRSAAREAFQQALALEPANADAERKYAELALFIGQTERTRKLLAGGEFDEFRGAARKDNSAAAARSLFFPGLGQLYNGEYEKGIYTVLAAFPLFGLLVWGLAALIGAASPKDPVPMTPFGTAAALLGLFGYGCLSLWSIWDAYRGGGGGKGSTTGMGEQ